MKKEDFTKFVKLYLEDPKFWYIAYYENALGIVQKLPEENLIDHLVKKINIKEMISEIKEQTSLEVFYKKQYFETKIEKSEGQVLLFYIDRDTGEKMKIFQSHCIEEVLSVKLKHDLEKICVTEIVV